MGWESDLLNAMRKETASTVPSLSPPIDLGTVIAPPPNLVVEVRGMQLRRDKGELLVSESLLKNYKRKLDIKLSDGNLHTPNGTTQHKDLIDAIATTKDELKAGDKVLVLPFADKQRWLVACKVV